MNATAVHDTQRHFGYAIGLLSSYLLNFLSLALLTPYRHAPRVGVEALGFGEAYDVGGAGGHVGAY